MVPWSTILSHENGTLTTSESCWQPLGKDSCFIFLSNAWSSDEQFLIPVFKFVQSCLQPTWFPPMPNLWDWECSGFALVYHIRRTAPGTRNWNSTNQQKNRKPRFFPICIYFLYKVLVHQMFVVPVNFWNYNLSWIWVLFRVIIICV